MAELQTYVNNKISISTQNVLAVLPGEKPYCKEIRTRFCSHVDRKDSRDVYVLQAKCMTREGENLSRIPMFGARGFDPVSNNLALRKNLTDPLVLLVFR
jgi:hypothetical protein